MLMMNASIFSWAREQRGCSHRWLSFTTPLTGPNLQKYFTEYQKLYQRQTETNERIDTHQQEALFVPGGNSVFDWVAQLEECLDVIPAQPPAFI